MKKGKKQCIRNYICNGLVGQETRTSFFAFAPSASFVSFASRYIRRLARLGERCPQTYLFLLLLELLPRLTFRLDPLVDLLHALPGPCL